jgi:purine-binding chemotaxis protein CheW
MRTDRRDVIVVRVGELRCALTLDAVIEVLPIVAISPLPRTPDVIEGLIDVRGTLVPVLSLRTRLSIRGRPPEPDDHLVLCAVAGRTVGIWVDHAEDVTAVDPADLDSTADLAAADFLPGVARLHDGLLLVYDIRTFLAADEVLCLDEAMADLTAGR